MLRKFHHLPASSSVTQHLTNLFRNYVGVTLHALLTISKSSSKWLFPPHSNSFQNGLFHFIRSPIASNFTPMNVFKLFKASPLLSSSLNQTYTLHHSFSPFPLRRISTIGFQTFLSRNNILVS